MSTFTQAKRIGELKTPLGKDKLLLVRLDGTEAISELFEFRVEAISPKDPVASFDSVLGKNCTVTVKTIAGAERHFTGTATEVRLLGRNDVGYVYELVLRPWLWMMGKRANSLIFHKKTAVDIIKKIFDANSGFAKYSERLSKSYPELEYTVQHNETDLDFVCRLMEANGIAYYFKHEDDKQTLVLSDSSTSYDPVDGSKRKIHFDTSRHTRAYEHLFYWGPERRFTTGKAVTNDYDFKKPTSNLLADKPGSAGYENGQLEEYVHPYRVSINEGVARDKGSDYSNARITMHQAEDERYFGSGDLMALAAGNLMTLDGHPDGGLNVEYLTLRAMHSFVDDRYRSGSGGGEAYQGQYEFLKSSKDFAPAMVTPRPYIAGVQTARVIAEKKGSEEIDADDQGRILVHFHWNREDEGKPEGQSMRCRVAQLWAGSGWGGQFIPRVDMEVLVQFIDGDPSRPIVVGCVYNGDNKMPYETPGKAQLSGIRSQSTKDKKAGFNELMFDDTKGSELVRFHAEKDNKSKIKNERTTHIGFLEPDSSDDLSDPMMGVGKDTLKVGGDILIQSETKITLKVKDSTITITPISIEIKSMMIKVDASVMLDTHSGAITTEKSDGVFIVKGAIVLVN